MIKTFNDIESLYQQPILQNSDNYLCPVCGKTAKREATIQKHMSEMDCYSTNDLLKNTVFEERAFRLCKHVIEGGQISLNNFRKIKSNYTMYSRFILFCAKYEIDEKLYFDFLCKYRYRGNFIYAPLTKGLNENDLRDFYLWLHVNYDKIDSAGFCEKYDELIKSDPNFFCRSIEKAKISYHYVVADEELLNILVEMDDAFQIRIHELMDKVEEFMYANGRTKQQSKIF